jgi:hypothetical protein
MTYVQKAGSVALVNYKKEVIYEAKIFRKFRSYRTTIHTRKKNGFTNTSLQSEDCLELDKVQADLEGLMDGKLIVGVSLIGDFSSLELSITGRKVFDLQWHWYQETKSSRGRSMKEPLGLRSLCHYYFGEDVQPTNVIHTAAYDACQTMRLFRDVYVKIDPDPKEKDNPEPSNHIPHFK